MIYCRDTQLVVRPYNNLLFMVRYSGFPLYVLRSHTKVLKISALVIVAQFPQLNCNVLNQFAPNPH